MTGCQKSKKRSSQLAAHNKLRCTQTQTSSTQTHTETNNGQHVAEHDI